MGGSAGWSSQYDRLGVIILRKQARKRLKGMDRMNRVGKEKKNIVRWLGSLVVFCILFFGTHCSVAHAQLLELRQNHPNPFNSETEIEYSLPGSGHVTLKVFNMLGKEVQTLLDEDISMGGYKVRFDGTNLPSGQYTYTMIYTSGTVSTKLSKKMYLVK